MPSDNVENLLELLDRMTGEGKNIYDDAEMARARALCWRASDREPRLLTRNGAPKWVLCGTKAYPPIKVK